MFLLNIKYLRRKAVVEERLVFYIVIHELESVFQWCLSTMICYIIFCVVHEKIIILNKTKQITYLPLAEEEFFVDDLFIFNLPPPIKRYCGQTRIRTE